MFNIDLIALIKVFSVFCFSKIGYELLELAIEKRQVPDYVFSCSTDSIHILNSIKELCDHHKIKHINMNNSVDPLIYLNDSFLKKSNKDKLIFLLWWPHILKANLINKIPRIVNIHTSYLPYGKGKHGYVWAIENNEKFGASIHLVDEGIDSGPILCQEEIPIEFTDSGGSLYDKSVLVSKKLFKNNLINIINNNVTPLTPKVIGSKYSSKELYKSNLNIDKRLFTIKEAIDFLRARTFENGKSFSIKNNYSEYEITIKLKKISPIL